MVALLWALNGDFQTTAIVGETDWHGIWHTPLGQRGDVWIVGVVYKGIDRFGEAFQVEGDHVAGVETRRRETHLDETIGIRQTVCYQKGTEDALGKFTGS